MNRTWLAIPIALIALVVVGVPVLALTESGLEEDLKRAVGYRVGGEECQPTINRDSRWRSGPSLPVKRDEPRAVAIDGRVYLVGGVDAVEQSDDGLLLQSLDDLTRFDPETRTYESLAPMPRALNHMAAVAYDGDLYVLGGYQQRIDANTRSEFFRYDVERDRWSRLPPLPSPRAAMAVGVVGDRLIVAGGAEDRDPLASTLAFDFGTERWSELADMPTEREHVAGAVVGQSFYALGGRAPHSDALDDAARYDVATDSWEELPPLPVPTGGLDAVVVDGAPVAVGGGDDRGGTVTGAVQRWDAERERWTQMPGLRIPRHGHAAAVVGDRVWVFGGSHCAYFTATDDVESLRLPAR